MRALLPPCSLRTIVICSIVLTLASPAMAITSPPAAAPDPSTTLVTSPASTTPVASGPLDVSARTIREAARASVETSDGSPVDRAPSDQSKPFKELQPTCNKWVALAELAAKVAICATDHCGYTGSASDRFPSPVPVEQLRPSPVTCASKGVKLW